MSRASYPLTPLPYMRPVRRTTWGGKNRVDVTATGFLRTEGDALFVVTRSDAARAVALTRVMNEVFIAVRRPLLVAVSTAPRQLPPPCRRPCR